MTGDSTVAMPLIKRDNTSKKDYLLTKLSNEVAMPLIKRDNTSRCRESDNRTMKKSRNALNQAGQYKDEEWEKAKEWINCRNALNQAGQYKKSFRKIR